jgi:hypothetical protein
MISINCRLDVLGALDEGSLRKNLYMFDNQRREGSHSEGTIELATAVNQGDQILWTLTPLEVESFAEIAAIGIDPEVCEPVQGYYVGSTVSYWLGAVKKAVDKIDYSLVVRLGPSDQQMTLEEGPSLIGATALATNAG